MFRVQGGSVSVDSGYSVGGGCWMRLVVLVG